MTSLDLTASGHSALLIGATGATGKHLLRELLTSSYFTRVAEAGRRVTPKEQLPSGTEAKLQQIVVDFEKIGEAGLKDGKWDVVFITYVFLLGLLSMAFYPGSYSSPSFSQVGYNRQSRWFQGCL